MTAHPPVVPEPDDDFAAEFAAAGMDRLKTGPTEQVPKPAKAPHAAGPWHVGVGGNQHANRVWTADMQPVAVLCSFSSAPADLDPTAQANAQLIASAPTLLAERDALRAALIEAAHALERAADEFASIGAALGAMPEHSVNPTFWKFAEDTAREAGEAARAALGEP